MLKQHFAIVNLIRASLDFLTIGVLWNAVYFSRFHSGLFSHSGIPSYTKHLLLTFPVVVIFYLCRRWSGIYQSIRIESIGRQLSKQVQSILLEYTFVVLFLYYSEKVPYTRTLLILFLITLLAVLLTEHCVLVLILRSIRSKGYNQRCFAIIGTGKNAIKLSQDIQGNSYFGLKCSFFIDNKPQLDGKMVSGIKVYGNIEKLNELAIENGIDEIYLAANEHKIPSLYSHLNELQNRGITVRIQPDWGRLTSVAKPSIITIGSSVLFTAAESPLTGMNLILKDIFDRVLSFILLCLFSSPMLLI